MRCRLVSGAGSAGLVATFLDDEAGLELGASVFFMVPPDIGSSGSRVVP
ncbi:MAG: hypothetical protein WBB42_05865 [Polyangiales bacterium]